MNAPLFSRLMPEILMVSLLISCSAPSPRTPLTNHLHAESAVQEQINDIPQPVTHSLSIPRPKARPKTETYSVVVNNVPAHELLYALARDAKINVDIHPGISGSVTLNAIDQTLPQLLSRIARQIDMRFELEGPNLAVMPDTPFLKHYDIDYVNMARNVTAIVATNSQIATTQPVTTGTAPGAGGNGGNISNTRIENSSKNQFWEALEKNIKDILRETDKVLPPGSSETTVEQNTTLVEIAIVLVIIGLLLGGVLKGQELVNSAKVKNLAGDLKAIPLFIYGYQDKFRRLPGDDPDVATRFGTAGTLATTPTASTAGNGIIEGKWNSRTVSDENVLFWQHVRLAGLASGSTDFTDGTTASLPTNAEGGQIGLQMSPPISGLSGTYYACSSGIGGKLAQQLDTTIDDGTPDRGSLRAQESATDATKPGVSKYEEGKSYVVCLAF